MHMFLQVLDEVLMMVKVGLLALSDAIIIMTSNGTGKAEAALVYAARVVNVPTLFLEN